jgi:hypothetical protein
LFGLRVHWERVVEEACSHVNAGAGDDIGWEVHDAHAFIGLAGVVPRFLSQLLAAFKDVA